ncbi:O-antigen polymerase [Bhargavaea cecembensis]|nr:O-antigen polymerase [Bhargavaea cecembensis]
MKFVSVFLWATLLVMFGIPHFLSVVFNQMEYGYNVMIKASIFVILFNSIYLFSRFMLWKIGKKRKNIITLKEHSAIQISHSHFPSREKLLYVFFFVGLIASFVALLLYTNFYLGSIFNANWGSFYVIGQNLGYGNVLKYTNLLFFATAGVALVFRLNGKKKLFVISSILVLFYSLITGNRITILPLFIALIIPYVFNEKRNISLKQVIFFTTAGLVVIYSVYFLRLLRIYGGFYLLMSNFDFWGINNQIITMLLSGDGELSLRNTFYRFIEIDNDWPGFNEAHTYIRLLLIAIPTSLSFGLKPPDFAITMGSASLNNIYNTKSSMHPTLYGDVFANLWWFGIFLGVFWAILNSIVDNFVNRRSFVIKAMLIVLFGVVYVIAGRGSVYNGFFIGYTGCIIIFVVFLMTRLRLSK